MSHEISCVVHYSLHLTRETESGAQVEERFYAEVKGMVRGERKRERGAGREEKKREQEERERRDERREIKRREREKEREGWREKQPWGVKEKEGRRPHSLNISWQ